MTSESAIVAKCARHFARQGYWIGREVPIGRKVADLYCVDQETSECVAIEAKMTNWRGALEQALVYQLGADRVYIAMPELVARRVPVESLAEFGIGLLGVPTTGRTVQLLAAQHSVVRRRSITQRALAAVGKKAARAGLSV